MSRAILFNRAGQARRELVGGIFPRSYILADPERLQLGECTHLISTREESGSEDLFDYMTLIYIRHPYLPPWAGVLVGQEYGPWQMRATYRAPETLLDIRRGPTELKITGTVGEMARKLLSIANGEGDTLIREGSIFEGGSDREETINLTRISSELSRICGRAGYDWWVDPALENGGKNLSFRLNLAERRGLVIENFGLYDDKNIKLPEDSAYHGTRPEANDLAGYGQGMTWESRNAEILRDEESIRRWGLIQGAKAFDTKSIMGIRSATAEHLRKSAWPEEELTIDVTNDDETWRYIRLGNQLPVTFYSLGWRGLRGTARVNAFSYSEETGVVPATVKFTRGQYVTTTT